METPQASIPSAIKVIRSSKKQVGELAVYKFIKKSIIFTYLFNVGTSKQLIAGKNQPLNIITMTTKTIIITKMTTHGYIVIFIDILNNRNQYL